VRKSKIDILLLSEPVTVPVGFILCPSVQIFQERNQLTTEELNVKNFLVANFGYVKGQCEAHRTTVGQTEPQLTRHHLHLHALTDTGSSIF
jgi:hypothetical protein